ncbi:MAG: hypothetical protein AABZ11_08225 [Nitrospinota bacterium]|jgi:hypothetical protein
MVCEVNNLLTLDPALIKTNHLLLEKRNLNSIFAEIGINPSLPSVSKNLNPLPDHKALDDIVFDILSLQKTNGMKSIVQSVSW